MLKLVEDVSMGETVIVDANAIQGMNDNTLRVGDHLTIVGKYPVSGEGRGFVAERKDGVSINFSKACGTYLDILPSEVAFHNLVSVRDEQEIDELLEPLTPRESKTLLKRFALGGGSGV